MHINFHHAIYHFKVLSNKMIILSRNCPFVVVLRGSENGDPPYLFVPFTRYGYTKNVLRTKKSLDRRSFTFLDMNDLNFRIKSHREVRDNVKTVQLI